MKLVPKMAFGIVSAMTLVVGVYVVSGFLEHRRQFVQDTRSDNAVMARTLADGVAAAVKLGGNEAGRQLVDAVDRHHPDVSFAWFTPDRTIHAGGIMPVRAVAQELNATDGVLTVTSEAEVIADDGTHLGSVSIVDSLADEEKILAGRSIRVLLTTCVMAAVGAGLAIALGHRYVAGPVRALCNHAARIGRGEFDVPLVSRGNDELAQLAEAMNQMAQQLAASAKRARDETEARLAALEQLRHVERLATVGKLAAGIAHELGTPLNVVAARAAMIESGEEAPQDVLAYARMIRDQTAKMSDIIRSLLGFARQRAVAKTSAELGAMIASVCAMIRPLAQRRRVHLRTSHAGASWVRVDRAQVEQVLTNVIMNAVQACSEGGIVAISLEPCSGPVPSDIVPSAHGFVRVRVHDDGHGIGKDDLPRIFDPFFTTKEIGQGTGLGLSVAYGIMRDHGGWIDVESPGTGAGSTFCVHLPLLADPPSLAVAEANA